MMGLRGEGSWGQLWPQQQGTDAPATGVHRAHACGTGVHRAHACGTGASATLIEKGPVGAESPFEV